MAGFSNTLTGTVVYANVNTNGTTDNWATLQAIVSAGQVALLPTTGSIAISQPIVMNAVGGGLAWNTPGPEFITLGDITAYAGLGGQLVPTAGWSGGTNGALVDVEAANCSITGGMIHAGTTAARAVYANATQLILDNTNLCGGSTCTLDSGASCSRVRIYGGQVINVENSGSSGLAMNCNGTDWNMFDINKKGGSICINGNDYLFHGGHLTGATTTIAAGLNGSANAYSGCNVILQQGALTFVGVIFDTVNSGANGLIAVDNNTNPKPGVLFVGCKFLGAIAQGATSSVFYHYNANDMPIIVSGTSYVEANAAGQGFTALITNPLANDQWGGNTVIAPNGWSNGAGGNGTPTASNLFSGGVSPTVLGANVLTGTTNVLASNVSTPTFANGVAAQLAQTLRPATVYLTVGTAGTAMVIAIGPTSTPANTVISSSVATTGEVYAIRVPAGWYLKWSATTATIANQVAITE